MTSKKLASTLLAAATGGLAAGCGGVSATDNTPGENDQSVLFTNTGENCRNFLIISPVTEANARKFVPAEFTLVQPPTAFVELADCPQGKINGVDVEGGYRIAEAAVFITPPDGGANPPLITNSAIYLLWQLDSNAELSDLKRTAGFAGELIENIELVVEPDATVPLLNNGYANVPYAVSPYQLNATLTPDSPPGPPLPNDLWHVGPNGPIHTFNDIYATDQVLAGLGTISVAEGSPLHELFGSTTVTGLAASGIGSFENTTQLRQDIQATKPEGAP